MNENINTTPITLPTEDEICYSPGNQKTQFYCYIYMDPNQPGNYNYRNIEVKYKPIYIGNSSAYTSKTRWADHLNENAKNNAKDKNRKHQKNKRTS